MKSLKYYTYIVATILIAIGAQAQAYGGSGICDEIAARIRAGQADGPTQYGSDMVLPVLSAHTDGYVRLESRTSNNVAGVLEHAHATQTLWSKAKSAFDLGLAHVAWLGSTGAGAIEQTGGTASCTHFLFFDMGGGEIHEIASPSGRPFDDTDFCWNSDAWIGTIGSAPVFITEETAGDTRSTQITLVPWQHNRWGEACRVEATFAPAWTVAGAFCRKDADCHGMQEQALNLAKLLDAAPKKIGASSDGVTTEIPRSLAALIPSLKNLDQLPTFGKSALMPYTRLRNTKMFGISVDDTEVLAIAGPERGAGESGQVI